MAKIIKFIDDEFDNTLTKSLQSGKINFLVGSGASLDAISTAGNIEKELDDLIAAGNVQQELERKFEFLAQIQTVTNKKIDAHSNADIEKTLNNYQNFLKILANLLTERKSDLLTKQVTIFTTNYDLFIEHAADAVKNIRLNDGFNRNPSLSGKYHFEPETFFDVSYKTSALFNHEYPVPTINLIKMHGSLSWTEKDEVIVFEIEQKDIPEITDSSAQSQDMQEFVDQFSLILPTSNKYNQSMLDRYYYDLLRIYANTLEVENTVVISFGFSFADQHILDITKRALKNPTLLLIIIAYSGKSVAKYEEKFNKFNNVIIVDPGEEVHLDFPTLNTAIEKIIPKFTHGY